MNAYAEPVVSLDLDIVVAIKDIETACKAVEVHFKIERFSHSVNLSSKKSDLKIKLRIDQIIEIYPHLADQLPDSIRKIVE